MTAESNSESPFIIQRDNEKYKKGTKKKVQTMRIRKPNYVLANYGVYCDTD